MVFIPHHFADIRKEMAINSIKQKFESDQLAAFQHMEVLNLILDAFCFTMTLMFTYFTPTETTNILTKRGPCERRVWWIASVVRPLTMVVLNLII